MIYLEPFVDHVLKHPKHMSYILKNDLHEIYEVLIKYYRLNGILLSNNYPTDFDTFYKQNVTIQSDISHQIIQAAYMKHPRDTVKEIFISNFHQIKRCIARLWFVEINDLALKQLQITMKEKMIWMRLMTFEFASVTYATDKLIEFFITYDKKDYVDLLSCVNAVLPRLQNNPKKLKKCFDSLFEILSEKELYDLCQQLKFPKEIFQLGISI